MSYTMSPDVQAAFTSLQSAVTALQAAVNQTSSVGSLALVSTGATGTQISTTKNALVMANVTTSTTATIGGASTSAVALKVCSTNNATEGNWTTVAILENDQTVSLAVALSSVQVIKGQPVTQLPAGWYVKIVNSGTGTHSESILGNQQILYG